MQTIRHKYTKIYLNNLILKMKGLEALEKYYSTKEEKKSGSTSPTSKLPLLRKLDYLHELYNEVKSQDKKSLTAIKKRVVTVLDSLTSEGSGAMISRVIEKIHTEIFEQVDRSRLPQFFDKEIQTISSSKAEAAHKMFFI